MTDEDSPVLHLMALRISLWDRVKPVHCVGRLGLPFAYLLLAQTWATRTLPGHSRTFL